MIPKQTVQKIIPILKRDVKRILRMRVTGFPAPYYASFLLRDINWFNTWASSGSMYRRRSDRTRSVYADLRVGSYRYDQISDGGLADNDDERESFSHVNVPIDDSCYDGLRIALWRLSEAKFREALSDYNYKESARISTIDPNFKLKAFQKLKAVTYIQPCDEEEIDEERWTIFCKNASSWMSELPHISSSWVDFDATQETKIFVNTENRIIVQHKQIYTLSATFRKLTKGGSHIEQELILNCATQKELPDMRTFKKLALEKYEQLLKLSRAKTIHAFSGPVLLMPGPAGLLFHEAIGHRLEGSRLLSSGEGQTFKGQLGKKVLELELSIHDNPKLKKFKGRRTVGCYDFDDEGTPAQNALLIEKGILRDFLNTRAATSSRNFNANGHARNRKFERPISRMAVTIVEGRGGLSFDELKAALIKEIRLQKKPFGMIVYDTCGGETETTKYDFQAFSGEISYATLLYPNGKEICVRGVNFVGTPLQALSNIIAIGKESELDNGFCGAESGFIPISTISPAILIKNLELQAKDEELVTPYILQQPRLY